MKMTLASILITAVVHIVMLLFFSSKSIETSTTVTIRDLPDPSISASLVSGPVMLSMSDPEPELVELEVESSASAEKRTSYAGGAAADMSPRDTDTPIAPAEATEQVDSQRPRESAVPEEQDPKQQTPTEDPQENSSTTAVGQFASVKTEGLAAPSMRIRGLTLEVVETLIRNGDGMIVIETKSESHLLQGSLSMPVTLLPLDPANQTTLSERAIGLPAMLTSGLRNWLQADWGITTAEIHLCFTNQFDRILLEHQWAAVEAAGLSPKGPCITVLEMGSASDLRVVSVESRK